MNQFPQVAPRRIQSTVDAAYQACLDQARQQSFMVAKRWYTLLAEKLMAKATTPLVIAEKRQIHEAWAALIAQQATIEQGFPAALAQAVAQELKGGAGGNANWTARSMSPLRFGDLELMGDAQVQETLDEARLQQVFLLASDAGFTGFCARLSTAQGFDSVKIDKNPLRPEVFARALATTLQSLPVEPAVRGRWLVYGGQIMGEQLQLLYAQLGDMLERQGVKEAAYKVTSAPDKLGGNSQAPRNSAEHARGGGVKNYPGPSDGQPGSPDQSIQSSREKLLTLDHLHRLMSGEYDHFFSSSAAKLFNFPLGLGKAAVSAAKGAAAHGSSSMSAALGALADLEKKAAGKKDGRNVRPKPPMPVALIREQLKADACSLGQSLAIEVVGLMIEQLSADARLLAPVRQVIANAEPAFLRIGMLDARFFSDKNHPARQLLEAITAKSLAFYREDASGFAEHMRDLQKVALSLAHEDVNSEQDFEIVLRNFEARQAKRNVAAALAQQQAVQALLQAEQRNLLAEKIAAEITQRADFVAGNRVVTAFVTGPWAQVMAKERQLGEHGELGAQKAVFSLALGDLLWSINFAQASRLRKRLVKIIPDLLGVLRAGLLSIGYPPAQSQAFFDELMRLHEQALTATVNVSTVQRDKAAALEGAFSEGDSAIKKQPWLAPAEAKQSGFMDFSDEIAQPHFEATVPQRFAGEFNGQKTIEEPIFQSTQAMQPGMWVELLANDQWFRAQLNWISPHNTLFMFTSTGGRSHSMTARMLEQLTSQGRFKVISQQGVLDGAFDSVAQTAIRNSVKGSS